MFLALPKIIEWLLAYKYGVLFPLAILEGPIVTILGGFLASLGSLSLTGVYITVFFGDFIRDLLLYFIGNKGRKRGVEKYASRFGITQKNIEIAEKHFQNHTKKTLILGKISHALGYPVMIAAGMTNVDFWEFFYINFLATLVKSAVLIVVGFYFGKYYQTISHYINQGVFVVIMMILIPIGGYTIAIKIKKHYFKK